MSADFQQRARQGHCFGKSHVGTVILGFFALLPFFFIFEFKKIKKLKLNFKVIFFYMFLLGFFLASGNIFQQISLIYTDVANSAVFTVLYVIIVPVLAYFFFSKKMTF